MMDICQETLEHARKLVLIDEVLNRELRCWHRHEKDCLGYEPDFIKWVDNKIVTMASNRVGRETMSDPPAKDIAAALRVNVIGDEAALLIAKTVPSGFETDVTSYVQEGVVCSNIWVHGVSSEQAKAQAEDVAAKFRRAGYSAEVLEDDEDKNGFTVSATLDFPLYLKMVEEDLCLPCLVCSRKGKWYNILNPNKEEGCMIMNMTDEGSRKMSVEERVRELIVDMLGVDRERIVPEASFQDDLGADSLDCVEVLMAMEEEFGIAIPEEDAEKLNTVGKAMEYLKSRVEQEDK